MIQSSSFFGFLAAAALVVAPCALADDDGPSTDAVEVDASVETLTFDQMKGEPTRWPADVTVTEAINLEGGTTLKPGDRYPVVGVTSDGVELAIDGGMLSLDADQTDLVEAANAMWAELTPKQRALTMDKIREEASLWPEKVKNTSRIELANGAKWRPGMTFRFDGFEGDQAALITANGLSRFTVDVASIDLVERAREMAEMDPAERPSKMADMLAGHMITSDGKSFSRETPAEYYALYYSASWCPPCRAFTPELVKFQNEHADDERVQFVLMGSDRTRADMLKYQRDYNMNFPGVPIETMRANPELSQFSGRGIPCLVIVDRNGSVLAHSYDGDQYIGPRVPLAKLGNMLETN